MSNQVYVADGGGDTDSPWSRRDLIEKAVTSLGDVDISPQSSQETFEDVSEVGDTTSQPDSTSSVGGEGSGPDALGGAQPSPMAPLPPPSTPSPYMVTHVGTAHGDTVAALAVIELASNPESPGPKTVAAQKLLGSVQQVENINQLQKSGNDTNVMRELEKSGALVITRSDRLNQDKNRHDESQKPNDDKIIIEILNKYPTEKDELKDLKMLDSLCYYSFSYVPLVNSQNKRVGVVSYRYKKDENPRVTKDKNLATKDNVLLKSTKTDSIDSAREELLKYIVSKLNQQIQSV